MNVMMFLMIHLCVNVKRKNAIMKTRDRVFTGKLYLIYFLLQDYRFLLTYCTFDGVFCSQLIEQNE